MSKLRRSGSNIPTEDEGTKKQVTDLKAGIRLNALEIIVNKMPQKIIALDTLYKTDPRVNKALDEVSSMFERDFAAYLKAKEEEEKKEEEAAAAAAAAAEPAAKRKKKDEEEDKKKKGKAAEIPSNTLNEELMGLLRGELIELLDVVNTVKTWIQLNIPKIEDGNNFGVDIQEEIVGELGRVEESGFNDFEDFTKYYIARAKLVTKCIKYPTIGDYRNAVYELDKKQFLTMRISVLDLRNSYSILYDTIQKNIEKIKNPRSSDHIDRLY